ncbi:histidine phosphatase family protein [Gracilimonas mengyeensis]|uniref:Probable phosphoglycerate mutase n=1 Tax=Gracilimonas mengyeensis TaxID=1302730 RepID=A0A521FNA3_9BACT|nr:histidine phosphatase family protein [Gracilimonas mengyeensis]SMO97050.1 probable phosphoglycerate mutase [Gracilimonas mengyeensis]
MKQLFFIRHGETDNNKTGVIQGRGVDASLNDTGRMQAQAIIEALENYEVERIVASGLVRTHETVQPLADQRKLTVEKYPELDEIDFGVLEGRAFTDIKDEVEVIHNEWKSGNVDFAPDEGESPRQTFARANAKVVEILETAKEEIIVFMIHGRLTRILLSEWLGYGLQNMHKVKHQNAAINHLTWKDGKFEAVKLNQVNHLKQLV